MRAMSNPLKGKARTLRRDIAHAAHTENVQLNVRISQCARDRAAQLAQEHNVPLWYLIQTAIDKIEPDDLPDWEDPGQERLPMAEEGLRMAG